MCTVCSAGSAEDQRSISLHANLLRDTCRKLLGNVASMVKGAGELYRFRLTSMLD